MDCWIKENGICEEAELGGLIGSFGAAAQMIAFFTDRFLALPGSQAASVLEKADTLLELRLFDASHELWVYRSRPGAAFSWRLADDSGLEVPGPFAFESRQRLDIAADLGEDEYGCRVLRSTGGGTYALPMQKGDQYARLIHYLRYDEDGVAVVADWRLVRFEPEDLKLA